MPILTTQFHLQPIKTSHLTNVKGHLLPYKFLHLHPFKKDIRFKTLRCMKNPSENDPDIRDMSEKLFRAIKNRDLREFSKLIGEDIQNFRYVPLIALSFIDKKFVLATLSSVMSFLLSHIEFVIKPMSEGGADIGIRWNFEWKGTNLPFNLYSAHVYNGKLFLGNAKVNKELLRSMEEILIPILGKFIPQSVLIGTTNTNIVKCLLSLLFTVILLIFWNNLFE